MANTVTRIIDVPVSETVSNNHQLFSLDRNLDKSRLVNVDDLKQYILPNTKPYGLVGFYAGKPDANAIIALHVGALNATFPTNLANSNSICLTASTNTANFSIFVNNALKGNISFTTGNTTARIYCSAFTMNSQSVLKIVSPAIQDSTLSDISFTLLGNRLD